MKTCILAVNKDEPNVLEWVAWHLALGFDHIVLLDNSADDSPGARKLRKAAGTLPHRLTVKPFLGEFSDPYEPPLQLVAYDSAFSLLGGFDWVAVIDTDEYIAPVRHFDFMSALSGVGADVSVIQLNWHHFGPPTNVEAEWMIERIVKCSPFSWTQNLGTKGIYRPGKVHTPLYSTHIAKPKPGYQAQLAFSGKPLFDGAAYLPMCDHSQVKLNHYKTRSEAYWAWRVGQRKGRDFKGKPAMQDWHTWSKYFSAYDWALAQSPLLPLAKALHAQITGDELPHKLRKKESAALVDAGA